MGGEEETEAEEGDDDQVNESDRHGGDDDRGAEGSEVVCRKGDSWAEGLWAAQEVCARDGSVGEGGGYPCGGDFCGDFLLKMGDLRDHVAKVSILVASFDVDHLGGSQGVVGCVSGLDCLLEVGGGVGVDDDGCPTVEVVDCLADGQRVIVELRGWESDVAEVHVRDGVDLFGELGDHGADDWAGRLIRGKLGVEIDDVDDEG